MYHLPTMKRILSLYIIREITSLFLLGIAIFTLILLMGRLIKLTDMVISRGVPLGDVSRMIIYLMPSFLVFTIPMAFLLAVLLAFGRLSADNEITVLKAGGISLAQLMPPVLVCAVAASLLALAAGNIGAPMGNSAFKKLSINVLKQNVFATIREKIFWDDIPGLVLYTDHYDEEQRRLTGIIIHDSRETARPLTVFASEGFMAGGASRDQVRLVLANGSIHTAGKDDGYRLVNFGQYVMTLNAKGGGAAGGRNELDMDSSELRRMIAAPGTAPQTRFKMLTELHGRFALPAASLVFAVLAVPLGMQNRRSGKSGGFSISIAVLLSYYILMSLLRTLAERGALAPIIALWLPNIIFLTIGCFLLKMASQEQSLRLPSPEPLLRMFRRRAK